MNAYFNSFTKINDNKINDSDYIRKTYLANSRKKEINKFFTSIAQGLDSKTMWNILFILKIISGIVCAISFFSVIGMIEAAKISPLAGIICTIFIAFLETLCFLPLGKHPSKNK